MTRTLDLDRDLAAWLQTAGPADIDSAVVHGAFSIARRARQRRGLALVLAGPGSWPAYGYPTRRVAALGAAAVTVAVLGIGLAILPGVSGPGATPTPTETLPPSGAPWTSPPGNWPSVGPEPSGPAVPIDQVGGEGGPPGQAVLSGSTFGLPLTLWLEYFGRDPSSAPGSDWCAATTSPRQLVLPWRGACVADLRILRPSAVRCGTTTEQPGVDELAQAILRNPLLAAEDLGPAAGSAWLPPRLFADPAPTGRVFLIGGSTPFPAPTGLDTTRADPAGCLIVADAPNVEVRRDLPVLLILLDVRGELVIIDVSGGGYDGPSMTAARARGYRAASGAYGFYRDLLSTIHDLSFGTGGTK